MLGLKWLSGTQLTCAELYELVLRTKNLILKVYPLLFMLGVGINNGDLWMLSAVNSAELAWLYWLAGALQALITLAMFWVLGIIFGLIIAIPAELYAHFILRNVAFKFRLPKL